jgi:TRAP-type C4-dicarboxylate transport system permease small subunit
MTTDGRAGTDGRIARALRTGRRAAEVAVAVMFGAILVIFLANIAGRFGFNRPIGWADEVLVLLMLWVTFLTAAFVLDETDHVAFDLVYQRFQPRGRRVVALAGLAAIAVIVAAATPQLLGYIAFLWRERTNVLEIRLDVAFAVFGVFVVMLVAQRLWLIARLLRRDWRHALADMDGRREPGEGGA